MTSHVLIIFRLHDFEWYVLHKEKKTRRGAIPVKLLYLLLITESILSHTIYQLEHAQLNLSYPTLPPVDQDFKLSATSPETWLSE